MQTTSRTTRSGFIPSHVRRIAFAGTFVVALAGTASAQWPQWGGPNRDFRSTAMDLAEEWPEAGPRKVWERALGAGYSSIVADGGRLFTLYRSGEEEVVVCLDARTGATVWEHRYRPTWREPPNSTPTVFGDQVYTLGVCGQLCALDKNSGKLVWSHDLVAEYGTKPPYYGFSASPLVHGDLVYVANQAPAFTRPAYEPNITGFRL